LISGVKWLLKIQKNDGRFDWSKSGHLFSYHLSGSYAFAFSSFVYVSKWNNVCLKNANLCLEILGRNMNGLVFRWEKGSWIISPQSFNRVMKTAMIGNYPIKYRVFRFGYGLYREIARRRFSNQIDEKFFKNLTGLLRIQSSTIEPFNNYPDLFMTSEVLDCLSSSLLKLRGDPDILQ